MSEIYIGNIWNQSKKLEACFFSEGMAYYRSQDAKKKESMLNGQTEVFKWIGVLLFSNRTYIWHCAGPYPGIWLFQYQFNYHIDKFGKKQCNEVCSYIYIYVLFIFNLIFVLLLFLKPSWKPWKGLTSNKLANLRRWLSWVSFGLNKFGSD